MISHGGWKHRTLIVTNSDNPLSDQVADYYISKRGLVAHKLAFSLGTSMTLSTTASDALLANVLTPIANYCAANDIKIVLASAGCPVFLNSAVNAGGHRCTLSFAPVLGAARIFKFLGTIPVAVTDVNGALTNVAQYCPLTANNTLVTPYIVPALTSGTTADELRVNGVYMQALRIPNWEDYRAAPSNADLTSLAMASGRIGLPAGISTASYYGGPNIVTPTETFAATQRMIDDAVASEGSIGTTHFGVFDYAGSGSPVAIARLLAASAGVPVRHHIESLSNVNCAVPTASYDYAAWYAGTLAPKESLWGFIGTTLRNLPMDHPWLASMAVQRGAWMYNWTSFGLWAGAQLLMNGGCCAAGSVNEPFDTGLVRLDTFTRSLLRGASMAEAATVLGGTYLGWQNDVWGDPLYRPFANRRFSGSSLITSAISV